MLVKTYSLQLGANVTSAATNLKECYDKVYLQIPTHTSGGTQYVKASTDGTTFYPVYQDHTASGAAAVFQIAQGGGYIVPIPAGFNHYTIENTTGVTGSITYNFICMKFDR